MKRVTPQVLGLEIRAIRFLLQVQWAMYHCAKDRFQNVDAAIHERNISKLEKELKEREDNLRLITA
jgi:hypothetical protein